MTIPNRVCSIESYHKIFICNFYYALTFIQRTDGEHQSERVVHFLWNCAFKEKRSSFLYRSSKCPSKAKTKTVNAVGWRFIKAIRRSGVSGVVVPAAPSKNPCRFIFILAPIGSIMARCPIHHVAAQPSYPIHRLIKWIAVHGHRQTVILIWM